MTFPTEAQAREFLVHRRFALRYQRVTVIPTTHGFWAITGAASLKRPANVCAICGESFREFPNNPDPVADGVCCAYCDDHVVTPARIARAEASR